MRRHAGGARDMVGAMQTRPSLAAGALPTPAEAAVLTSSLVSDALDGLGRRDRCLGPELVPLQPGRVVIGRAFPVTTVRVERGPEVPYVGLLRALDEIGPGDVYVVSSGGARDVALWGELLSTIATARGAIGAICDGYHRDAAKIRELGFPVFSRGSVPLDIHGRFEVVGHGDPVSIDGIVISRGDLIVADEDGITVVPPDVEREAIERAVAKGSAEDGFRADVAAGMLPSQAFARHRVL
jgi:4-hydroxy-4-methyl-2-oxoglutarate aldolase